MLCAHHFFCSQEFKTTSNVFNSDVNIVNITLIPVCSLAVAKFDHWLMSSLRRRNKRYQNPEKAETNGNCSKLSAASTIPTTRASCHNLCALRLLHCKTMDLYVIGIPGILPYKHLSRSLEIFFRLHSTLARLYNAAVSAASRLCSAGSLAIIEHNFTKITKMSRLYSFFNLFSNIFASRKISQQNSLKITIIC